MWKELTEFTLLKSPEFSVIWRHTSHTMRDVTSKILNIFLTSLRTSISVKINLERNTLRFTALNLKFPKIVRIRNYFGSFLVGKGSLVGVGGGGNWRLYLLHFPGNNVIFQVLGSSCFSWKVMYWVFVKNFWSKSVNNCFCLKKVIFVLEVIRFPSDSAYYYKVNSLEGQSEKRERKSSEEFL